MLKDGLDDGRQIVRFVGLRIFDVETVGQVIVIGSRTALLQSFIAICTLDISTFWKGGGSILKTSSLIAVSSGGLSR